MTFDTINIGGSPQLITSTVYSSNFCPQYNIHSVVEKLKNFKYLYVLIAFFGGLFECFYGYRFFKPTLFVVGFVSGFIGSALSLFATWKGSASDTRFWTIIIFSALVGLTLGFFLPSLTRVSFMITGGVLIFSVYLLLYRLFLVRIVSEPPELFFYNFSGISSIIGLMVGFEFHK